MTLKPDPSQSSYRKVKVWNVPQPGGPGWGKTGVRGAKFRLNGRAKGERSQGFKSRFRWYHAVIACLLGAVTAVVQSLALHLTRPDLSQQLTQTVTQTVAQTVTQTVAQTITPSLTQAAEALGIIQPIAVPRAISGLPQPNLWSQAAKLAAYFGHLPYEKPDPTKLALFPSDPPYMTRIDEYLHQDAVAALKQMMEAAQKEGVSLFLVSGFRDLSTQALLFQSRSTEQGSAELAAKSVAPPGYSEHHTGYAVDLADGLGDFLDFEQTPAFRWMTVHAHEYGFELSFPLNNAQGVDYEPWHWRFVHSPEAAEVFAAARGRM